MFCLGNSASKLFNYSTKYKKFENITKCKIYSLFVAVLPQILEKLEMLEPEFCFCFCLFICLLLFFFTFEDILTV